MSPPVLRSWGISTPRSQPMVLFDGVHGAGGLGRSSGQFLSVGSVLPHHAALTVVLVCSPQNMPFLYRESQEKMALTGANLPFSDEPPYAPAQNCSMSATAMAPRWSMSPPSPSCTFRVGSGAPGRNPDGPFATGAPATFDGSAGAGIALPSGCFGQPAAQSTAPPP